MTFIVSTMPCRTGPSSNRSSDGVVRQGISNVADADGILRSNHALAEYETAFWKSFRASDVLCQKVTSLDAV